MSQEKNIKEMLETPLMSFTSDRTLNDNRANSLEKALALFSLVLSENESPAEDVRERIIAHLASVTSAEVAPSFEAICLWCYCPLTASIALAKATPSVWEALGDDTRSRLDFMMECFVYLESLATSDYNDYNTGPGLAGNYNKKWNPNYRLANVPVMLFATHYFGDCDMARGAEAVNSLLRAFDEQTYDRVIGSFERYGWHRAYDIWTTPARVHEDGTRGNDARTMLLYGGRTYALNYKHEFVTKEAGDGLGVTNGGQDYLYHGAPLCEPQRIIEDLLRFNYSGGEVKSEHCYDVDKDGVAERVAWIVGELKSPYQGQVGMMKEFASGNRSSTGYCSHDFVLCTCLIAASRALGIYDVRDDSELWSMICVGNGDFLFKNECGYQGFSTGSYGTMTNTHSEENENESYFAMKEIWQSIAR
jgi:hypothetical protein